MKEIIDIQAKKREIERIKKQFKNKVVSRVGKLLLLELKNMSIVERVS